MKIATGIRALTALACTLLSLGLGPVSGAAVAAEPSSPGEATAGLKYVSLGDSMVSNFGLEPYAERQPHPLCSQSVFSYPRLTAEVLGLEHVDASCSGASTEHITTMRENLWGDEVDVQSSWLSPDTDVVTLTIGSNDLGIAILSSECMAQTPTGPLLLHPDLPNCVASAPADSDQRIAELAAGLDSVFEVIAERSPDASIFVVGYPALVPDAAHRPPEGCFVSTLSGDPSSPLVANALPLTDIDLEFLSNIEQRLDEALRVAASAHGATFVDVRSGSLGNTRCADEGIPQYVTGLWAVSEKTFEAGAGSFHPTLAGSQYTAAQVTAAIATEFGPAVEADELLENGALSDATDTQRSLDAETTIDWWIIALICAAILLLAAVIAVILVRRGRRRSNDTAQEPAASSDQAE